MKVSKYLVLTIVLTSFTLAIQCMNIQPNTRPVPAINSLTATKSAEENLANLIAKMTQAIAEGLAQTTDLAKQYGEDVHAKKKKYLEHLEKSTDKQLSIKQRFLNNYQTITANHIIEPIDLSALANVDEINDKIFIEIWNSFHAEEEWDRIIKTVTTPPPSDNCCVIL